MLSVVLGTVRCCCRKLRTKPQSVSVQQVVGGSDGTATDAWGVVRNPPPSLGKSPSSDWGMATVGSDKDKTSTAVEEEFDMQSVSSIDVDEEEAHVIDKWSQCEATEITEKGAVLDDDFATVAAPQIPRPRPPKMSTVPFCYGFACGFGGLFMIYGVAANLGPEQTKLWLITSVSALGMKMCFSDPLKIFASTVFLQIAESLESSVLGDIAAFLAGDDDEV